MRNVKLMVELLEKMSNAPDGQILLVRTLGMSEQRREQYHHAELLSDAGLAMWKSDSAIRITNQGYDFLNAVNQDPPKYISKCKEIIGRGKTLLSAVNDIIDIVDKL